jgi:hypothetical protein
MCTSFVGAELTQPFEANTSTIRIALAYPAIAILSGDWSQKVNMRMRFGYKHQPNT